MHWVTVYVIDPHNGQMRYSLPGTSQCSPESPSYASNDEDGGGGARADGGYRKTCCSAKTATH